MKKILSVFVLLALGACTQDLTETAITVDNSRGGEATIVHSSKDATRGELIVKFAPESGQTLETAVSRSGATRSGIEGVDEILASVNASAIEPVFTITARNEANVRNAGLHLWYKLVFDEAADLDAVAAKLAKVAEVNVVQFNVKVKRNYNRRAVALDAADAAAATRASATRFSDPYLAKQWHFINTGDSKVTSPTKAGADVNCAQAWELCAGDPSIVVAVVDEGVMNSHDDLAANMWINTAEKNGSSNRDDDGNGYRDDIYGYNFVGNTGSVSWDAYGDVSHGTHVAGTISAVNGNGKGVCGIAGGTGNNDGVKIMSCQIFSGEDGATTAMTARAIQYACDNGAVILQCSWGYNSANSDEDQGPASDAEFNRECSAEKEAIDYFIANAGSETGVIKGGLAIFAAGNEYASLPGYPGGYEPCVSVAAMSADFTPSSFSNYGKGVDIAAPGGDSDYAKSANGTILSTLTPAESSTSNPYGYMEGTSMACPHVSGVAALGLSYAAKLGKHFTASEFRSMLLTAVNDIDKYMTGTKSYYYYYSKYGTRYPETMTLSNYKGNMGSGYTDAYRLLLQVEGTPCVAMKATSSMAESIDLATFFGGGAASLKFKEAVVSAEDKAAVGMTTCLLSGSKLYVVCSKPGVAAVTVTVLVGGTSQTGSNTPIATEVTKKFALVVRDGGTAGNGGWL